jgi:hypothetical protein
LVLLPVVIQPVEKAKLLAYFLIVSPHSMELSVNDQRLNPVVISIA